MLIIIDLVVVAFILLCVIMGYAKGLTGSLIKIVSFALALVIAFVLFAPVSNFVINNTQIDDNLEKTIREAAKQEQTETVAQEKKEEMSAVISNYISEAVENASNEVKENVIDSTAREVSVTIVKAGTWIVLFIVARILLIFLKFITSLVTKLPVIKQFDKLGGIIYGLLEGLIITYAVLAVISFIAPMTNGNFADSVSNSYVAGTMYNNNLLLKIIF